MGSFPYLQFLEATKAKRERKGIRGKCEKDRERERGEQGYNWYFC